MGAKLIVMYPPPKDVEAFERAYNDVHMPMAGPVFKSGGATKAVLTKAVRAPGPAPAFHRIIEVHFPSMEALQACASSKGGQEAVAHAYQISTGGAPVVLVAEEDVLTF
ncbi:MAG: EthD family reductase [Vicinamibacterales bacterium]